MQRPLEYMGALYSEVNGLKAAAKSKQLSNLKKQKASAARLYPLAKNGGV